MEVITLGIFEDNPAISVGLSYYLQQEIKEHTFEILFSTSSADEFSAKVSVLHPTILIMDIIADGVLGLELFETIFEQSKAEKPIVLAYSNVKSQRIIQTLLNLGVAAYIPKTEPMTTFQTAFDLIINQRNIYLPASLQHLKKTKELPLILTKMEKTIIPYLIHGLSTKEIAAKLYVSTNTIAFHKKNLFHKFRVNNIASFVKEAIAQGYSGGIHY